jgi:hypothetical protein
MSNCPAAGIVEQTLLPLKMPLTSFRIDRGSSNHRDDLHFELPLLGRQPARGLCGFAFLFVLMCFCASVRAQTPCNFSPGDYNPCNFSTAKIMAAIKNPHSDLITVSSHRGLHALVNGTNPGVPENSLQAIGLAAQAGIEMIELDIKLTSDNQAVMSHDLTLGRETDYGFVSVQNVFDPFKLPGNSSNDQLDPLVGSLSLAQIQGPSGGPPSIQLRDSVSLRLGTGNSEGVSSLQQVLNYLTSHQVAMVLALDLRDAAAATAAWNVISTTNDYLGNSYAQSTLFKIPAKAFLNGTNFQDTSVFKTAFAAAPGYTAVHFQPVYNTGDIAANLYGNETNMISQLTAFESDSTIDVTGVEIQYKKPSGILTGFLAAARTNPVTHNPVTISVFSPYVDYWSTNDSNHTLSLFFTTNGYCCVPLSNFYYNTPTVPTNPIVVNPAPPFSFPTQTNPAYDSNRPSDTDDQRGAFSFVVGQGYNSVTRDDAQQFASQLAAQGLRNLSYMQVTGSPGGPQPPDIPQPPGTTNPQPGAFLNHAALLGNVNDPNWSLNNIPFIEVPDPAIQNVYYYRWQTYKEHLVYTSPIYGWLATEFLTPASYGAPYGGINAAAGHHITEGRWLWQQQYVKDDINYWLKGPGQNSKPQDYDHNPDTSDWAHEYSFWAASSVWQWYLATGDQAFATSLLPQLQTQYHGWDNHYNSQLGLYWQYPVWDATEYSPASYESSDPYHGGAGYRPTINSYQFGDAKAIAQLASLAGNPGLASQYSSAASSLAAATINYLWDPQRNFFFHVNRDNNPSNARLDTREEEGFVPWMFELPTPGQTAAMYQLRDPLGFNTNYGPPTAEKRSSWYMYQAAGCCHWDGPSWPYETSQTLTGLANLLIDYPAQSVITANQYVILLDQYARTQYRNGSPYVAEAHDPDNNNWIYDTNNHSEDYNHSTYIDNVISGLFGLRGQPDNTLLVSPLAPASWEYFALENAPYHGHAISVLWDKTGSRYNQGAGLSVFVDGVKVASQSTPAPVRINVGATVTQPSKPNSYDIAVNSLRKVSGPKPIASYVFSPEDHIWNGIDGIVYRTGIPQNSRWTTFNSQNGVDYYGVDFQRLATINEIRLTFYDDGGGVRVPQSYILQYWTGSAWANLGNPGQTPPPNTMIAIDFSAITTSKIRVSAPNASPTQGWGLSELQAMSGTPSVLAASPGYYQIINVNSSKMMGVQNEYPFDGAQIQQYEDDGTPDHFWNLIDAGGGYFKLQNLATGYFLGVDQMSTTDSALLKQAQDNGTADHLWKFNSQGDGTFKIVNKNSGLLMGVDQMSTADSANIVQFHDSGTTDHLWIINPVYDPTQSVVYIAQNYSSNQVLAIQGASLADGAQIQQYNDDGTPDHMWTLDAQGQNYYIIHNVLSNLVLGVDHESQTNGALVKQAQNNGTPDHLWYMGGTTCPGNPNRYLSTTIANHNSDLLIQAFQESTAPSTNIITGLDHTSNGTADPAQCWVFVPKPDPRNQAVHRIRSVNSNLFIGPQNGAGSAGAQIVQNADGLSGLDWQVQNKGNGYYMLRNLETNMVLGVDQESKADSALIKQAVDNGSPDHLWQFIDQGNGQFKIKNNNSGLLLGIDQMSTAAGANIVQFHDSGTIDHLWYLDALGWPAKYPQ